MTVTSDVGAYAADAIARLQPLLLGPDDHWGTGVGQLLKDHGGLPGPLTLAQGRLDRLGCIQIGPNELIVDEVAIPWDRIVRVEYCTTLQMLTSRAVEREVQRLTSHLRLFPARRWVVGHFIDLVCGVGLAGGITATRSMAQPSTEVSDFLQRPVLAEVVMRGRLRPLSVTPGIFATMLLASSPLPMEALLLSARGRQLPVIQSPPLRAMDRADSFEAVINRLQGRLARLTDDSEDATRATADPSPQPTSAPQPPERE